MKTQGIKLNGMDDILVQIYSIKNIEEVSFTDLVPTPMARKQFNILPSLYVKYDGGKYLNLCSKDKYFDIFVKKVYEVSSKEKDKVFEDTRFGPFSRQKGIIIDDKTKSILDSGDLTKVNELYKSYNYKKSYDNSLLFQIDEVKLLLPIFKYHIKQLFDQTDLVITFNDNELSGYRNKYSINCKVNGLDDMLLLSFEKANNDMFYLSVRSKDKNFEPLVMRLEFGKDCMIVETLINQYALSSTNIYQADLDSVSHINVVRLAGEEIIYSNTELESVENPLPNITSIDSDIDTKWFLLPWGALYGVNNTVEKISDLESVISMFNKYASFVDDEFMNRENYALVYHRDRSLEAQRFDVVLDEMKKNMYGIKIKNSSDTYVIETAFDDDVSKNGYYDTYLGGKYFYHVTESKDLLGIDRDKLVSISKDNNIINGADLLDVEDVKKLIRGE